MKVQSFTVGPLQENCYLIVDEKSAQAVLVDPGEEAPRLIKAVQSSGAKLLAIWLTHAHVDHVGAVAPLVAQFDVPVALHPDDRPLYDRAPDIGRAYGMSIQPLPAPKIKLAEGDQMQLGELSFDVLHLPGHAPGHVAFLGHGAMFSGDVIFAGSIGRTDLPLCDARAMKRSLQRVATLDADLVVYCGHGPSTTIGRELRSNPFLSGVANPVGS